MGEGGECMVRGFVIVYYVCSVYSWEGEEGV